MNIVGYLVTLANIQTFGGPGSHLNDLSVKVADLASLANYLKKYPEFDLESFKKNSVPRVGNVGLYLSNNLREYLIHGIGNPYDEGTIITVMYGDHNEESDEEEYYLSHLSYLIERKGLTGDDINPFIQKYLV